MAGFYTLFYMPPQTHPLGLLISQTKGNLDYYPINSHVLVFIMAYMVFDFNIQFFVIKNFTPLGKQHYVHHAVVLYISIYSLLMGMAMPKLTSLALNAVSLWHFYIIIFKLSSEMECVGLQVWGKKMSNMIISFEIKETISNSFELLRYNWSWSRSQSFFLAAPALTCYNWV